MNLVAFMGAYGAVAAALAAPAGDGPLLSAQVVSSMRGRAAAPVGADIVMVWRGRQMLRGRLRLARGSGSGAMITRTSMLLLAPGEHQLRVTLPPVHPRDVDAASLRASFEHEDGRTEPLFDLGMAGASLGGRDFVMAICEGWNRPIEVRRDLVGRLRFEDFVRVSDPRLFATMRWSFDPEAMPADPLSLFAFDLVVVAGEGLRALDDDRLDALARWVRAGGSLCLAPAMGQLEALEPRHVAFLNDLAGADRFVLNRHGRVRSRDGVGIEGAWAGLGRVMFVTWRQPPLRGEPDWMRELSLLWDVRQVWRQKWWSVAKEIRERVVFQAQSPPRRRRPCRCSSGT
ncbi:MAG: hypothetical protein CMJ18_02400 [Phycisphaeraceae bacterium]|nr:hypothetical protein [Phycisphaeraceae bacterium]